jgi:hypothetical protein
MSQNAKKLLDRVRESMPLAASWGRPARQAPPSRLYWGHLEEERSPAPSTVSAFCALAGGAEHVHTPGPRYLRGPARGDPADPAARQGAGPPGGGAGEGAHLLGDRPGPAHPLPAAPGTGRVRGAGRGPPGRRPGGERVAALRGMGPVPGLPDFEYVFKIDLEPLPGTGADAGAEEAFGWQRWYP